jgi:hypothetical protein
MAALEFEILARCSTTRARVSRMRLPHAETLTPTFMPVATVSRLLLRSLTRSSSHPPPARNDERRHASPTPRRNPSPHPHPQQHLPPLSTTRTRYPRHHRRKSLLPGLAREPIDRFRRLPDGIAVRALFMSEEGQEGADETRPGAGSSYLKLRRRECCLLTPTIQRNRRF